MAKYSYAALQHQGAREKQEDSYLVRADIGLFVVCDGMGGHPAGEVASRMACNGIEVSLGGPLGQDGDMIESMVETDIKRSILDAHDHIKAYGKAHARAEGLATTCTALVLGDGFASVGHVGDSALFMLDPETQQIEWHTPISQGHVTDGLGTPGQPDIITGSIDTRAWTRFLLCSDGVTKNIPMGVIQDLMRRPALQECAQALVGLSLKQGGPQCDNITVICIEVPPSQGRDLALEAFRTKEDIQKSLQSPWQGGTEAQGPQPQRTTQRPAHAPQRPPQAQAQRPGPRHPQRRPQRTPNAPKRGR